MFKAPPLGPLLVAAMLGAATGVLAADRPADTGVRALELRPDGAALPAYPLATPPGGGRQDLDSGAATRAPSAYGDPSPDSGALPLAQFARGDKSPAVRGATGFHALVARVRDGGLPEPASWALMLIGFGMIGAALRGFVVANRRLAGLQPDETE